MMISFSKRSRELICRADTSETFGTTSMEKKMHKIELLAPAGSEDAFFAAIAAGANAVYFGTNRFNARERATNISLERLPFLTKIAHTHNVRMYMTLNIVFYDNEFSDAVELVGTAYKSGIDAVIVQDLGMISVLKNAFPNLEIHASTQMTTHNIAQCKLLSEMGVSQINLSRELSLDEIKPLAAFLNANSIVPEVFIHGAYCISFSGQCYFSGGLYGLPGNRGQCVQPCRREFCASAVTSGSAQDGEATYRRFGSPCAKGKGKNYLSPFNLKDNCAFSRIKELVEACGWSERAQDTKWPICSLKIEGRIKNADYVYAVTSAWREQLDKLENGIKTAASDERLSLSMNRGFSAGYLGNDISRDMFTSGKKDHSWTECGSVVSFRADSRTLLLTLADSAPGGAFSAPGNGDEVAIYGKDGSFICNASVKSVEKAGSKQISAKIAINGKLNGKIMPGQSILRIKHFLSDEALTKLKTLLISGATASSGYSESVADSCGAGADMRRANADCLNTDNTDSCGEGKTAVSVRISGQQGGLLETEWRILSGATIKDYVKGNPQQSHQSDNLAQNTANNPACRADKTCVTVRSQTLLSTAQKRSLDEKTITEKLGRLGGTSFFLAEIDCTGLAQNLFLPLGELNEIRRQAIALLASTLLDSAPQAENVSSPITAALAPQTDSAPKTDSAHQTTVSVPHLTGKQANTKNFRIITLLHSLDEYSPRTYEIKCATSGKSAAHQTANAISKQNAVSKTENAIFALEIPVLFRDGARDKYISFLNAHPDVLPYFPAILFETDINEAVNFLSELTKRVVICENAGLLVAAHDAGFSVVPGFHLNITNSYSSAEYCTRFKCPAVIPSPETTAAQLNNLTLPDNTELWLLPSAKNFLMQSRQCLVARASGCKKTATDRECLKNCERAVSLVGSQGERIIAEKRPGFYSCLSLQPTL